MMSWASLAGFGELKHGANDGFVAFDEHKFFSKICAEFIFDSAKLGLLYVKKTKMRLS